MRMRFSALARNDLISIGEWNAKENPDRAAEYVFELEAVCKRLTDFPLTGEKIGRYQKEYLRRKVYEDYLLLYIVRIDTIYIARVIRAAQDYLRFLD